MMPPITDGTFLLKLAGILHLSRMGSKKIGFFRRRLTRNDLPNLINLEKLATKLTKRLRLFHKCRVILCRLSGLRLGDKSRAAQTLRRPFTVLMFFSSTKTSAPPIHGGGSVIVSPCLSGLCALSLNESITFLL